MAQGALGLWLPGAVILPGAIAPGETEWQPVADDPREYEANVLGLW